jgi:hypothetical protein
MMEIGKFTIFEKYIGEQVMHSERKKMILVLSMSMISLMMEMIVYVDYLTSKNKNAEFIGKIIDFTGIFLWGWIPAILLSISSIVLTIFLRPSNIIFRMILILISIIIAVIGAIWALGLLMISSPGVWAKAL